MAKSSGGAGRMGSSGKGYSGRVRWDASNTHDGELMPNDDIHLGPKFFAWDEETKAEILRHEMGHWVMERGHALDSGAAFDVAMASLRVRPGDFGLFSGENSIEEAGAWAMEKYMIGASMPKPVKQWASAVFRRSGISPSRVREQAARLAKELNTQGPAGARMTLEELNG